MKLLLGGWFLAGAAIVVTCAIQFRLPHPDLDMLMVMSPVIFGGEEATVSASPIAAKIEGSAVCILRMGRDGKVHIATGVLISRDRVITARHVVSGKMGIVFAPRIGPTTMDDYRAGKLTEARLLAFPTASVPAGPASTPWDVAVLQLASPAPADYAPAKLDPEFSLGPGQAIYFAGYGAGKGSAKARGILRFSHALVSSVSDGVAMVSDTRTGICNDDSGGPVYADRDGSLTVVGILAITDCKSIFGFAVLGVESAQETRTWLRSVLNAHVVTPN